MDDLQAAFLDEEMDTRVERLWNLTVDSRDGQLVFCGDKIEIAQERGSLTSAENLNNMLEVIEKTLGCLCGSGAREVLQCDVDAALGL